MKSTLVDKKEHEVKWKFPCMGIGGELVVLFTNGTESNDVAKGVVVHGNEHHRLGIYLDCWALHTFEPFNGQIIIQN